MNTTALHIFQPTCPSLRPAHEALELSGFLSYSKTDKSVCVL